MAQLGSDPRLTEMLCAAGDDVHAIASAALLAAGFADWLALRRGHSALSARQWYRRDAG
ncbi:hypothetical protein E05_02710 [Plautia stali symbiont]|nr:hypothetical protein E05_02710 [Plautia stali symbiont]